MQERYLTPDIQELAFSDGKMAFLSGPRQVGKTTLGKMLLGDRQDGYFNWDDIEFRRLWAKSPRSLIPEDTSIRRLLVIDEIHKAKGWKRGLKGLFDTAPKPLDILVTGSARLNVYKKGSDSLLGRYLHFRLHPFSMGELESGGNPGPDGLLQTLREQALRPSPSAQSSFEALQRFGGFPDPLFSQNDRKARLWRRGRVEKVVREDLRDLSRIPELSRIEMLAALLPEKVGSLFTFTSLAQDLEVSQETVKRWVLLLQELYYLFEIKPYQGALKRSLKKEGKVYLWDWAEVSDKGSRFENLVAGHLLKACDYWTDTGEGDFRLHYLRDKEKREIDFLITRDGRPWMPVEAKWADASPSSSWNKLLPQLPCRLAVQVVAEPGYWKWLRIADRDLLIASASEFLRYWI